MRSLHLCLDIVMLALLLRLALATIRNSREIIITDAVGAPSPPSLPAAVGNPYRRNWGRPKRRQNA